MSPVPFPIPDPTPLPLPFGVLKALLLVSFGLHILAVDVGVGGALLCAGLVLRGRGPKGEPLMRVARTMSYVLPPAVTFAITLGVAPLLFVQLLYGEALYTSTILIGGPWVLFIFILMTGYFLLYRFTDGLKGHHGKKLSPAVGVVSALMLLSLGFLWTNNVTLMLAPERWSDLHLASPHGASLNLGDPTVIPRFLHMTVAMVAVAGLLLGVAAAHFESDEHMDRAVARRVGFTVFAYGSLLQLVFGTLTLVLQRSDILHTFLGGSPFATGTLVTAIACAAAAIVTALRARDPKSGKAGARLPLLFLLVTVSSMVTIRDIVRDTALATHGFSAASAPVVVDMVAGVAFFASAVIWAWATRLLFVWVFGGRAANAAPPSEAPPATAPSAARRAQAVGAAGGAPASEDDEEGDHDGD